MRISLSYHTARHNKSRLKVAYVLFCKMILRPCTQYIFGKKEDTSAL